MLQIIRIVFWVFIISQVVLLLAHQKIRFPVTQTGLAWSLGLKIFLIVAYAVYVNICFYAQEPAFLRFAFWMNFFFRALAYIFEIMLVFLVWFAFLQHTVKKDKVYRMENLCAEKDESGDYRVYGTIYEGKHDFNAVAFISNDQYMELAAVGYFDKAGAHKTLQVVYDSLASDSTDYKASIIVALLPRLVMPKQTG